jgi:uncharacterized protein (TIGR02466 family)
MDVMPMTDSSELKINVHNLFPTPVVRAEIPDSEKINAALRPLILQRMASHPGTQHSNLGGWQSTWDFTDWGGEVAAGVLEHAADIANRVTCDRQGQKLKIKWKINAWANVNGPGHGNEFHTHPGNFWSGTYYVDDGYGNQRDRQGGEFEMQDPRGVAPAMYAPLLAFDTPGGLSIGASETTQPITGHMILFPAWLSHAVRPYAGTKDRISIAFNLSV